MFMNFFRIAGDMCHLLSFVVMFWKLHSSQSVAGISLKTQELYVFVFVARYLDLFWNFLSIYNWIMKVIFIACSVGIVCIIRFGVPHKDTYNKEDDAFPQQYLVIPALLLGISVNQDHSSPFEMCWVSRSLPAHAHAPSQCCCLSITAGGRARALGSLARARVCVSVHEHPLPPSARRHAPATPAGLLHLPRGGSHPPAALHASEARSGFTRLDSPRLGST